MTNVVTSDALEHAQPAPSPGGSLLELARLSLGAETAVLALAAHRPLEWAGAPRSDADTAIAAAAEVAVPEDSVARVHGPQGWTAVADTRGPARAVLLLAGERAPDDTRLLPIARAVFDEVRERGALRGRVRRAEAALASLEHLAGLGVFSVDVATGAVTLSPRARQLHGLREGAHGPETLRAATQFYPEEVRGLARLNMRNAIAERSGFSFTLPFRRADGALRTVRCFGSVTADESGDTLIGILEDITEKKEAELRLWWTANHDGLTTLPNRTLFQDRLAVALEEANRTGGCVGLILCDLDDFKTINDVFGHEAGDHALRCAADALRAHTRQGDTLARLGGDEFAVIVGELARPGDIDRPLQRLMEAAEIETEYRGIRIRLTLSLGAAVYPSDAKNERELYRNADLALFRSKRDPWQRGTLYEPAYGLEQDGRDQRLQRIREAVTKRAIAPYYQPIVDLGTGAVVGVEVLARWREGEDLMNATALAPAFEDAELAPLVGRSILEQLTEDWATLSMEIGATVPLSINASPRELQSVPYLKALNELFALGTVDPGRLVLEVSENPLTSRRAPAREAFERLTERGIAFGFGSLATGFAALVEPTALRVQQIKVNATSLTDAAVERRAGPVLRGMLETCRALGVNLIATEIETAEQLSRLRALGYGLGQGFLFAKAMSFPEFSRRMRRERSGRPPAHAGNIN